MDPAPVKNNVRYAPNSDHSRYEPKLTLCAISGLMHRGKLHCLFDHLVGEQQERLTKREAERLGRLEVDHEFKLVR
jgi:hypothetical protein